MGEIDKTLDQTRPEENHPDPILVGAGKSGEANNSQATESSATLAETPEVIAEYWLTHGQRALWLLQQIDPTSAAYNIVYAARFSHTLDLQAFRRALQQLVDRHPALRTTFTARQGEPLQRIHRQQQADLRVVEAAHWSPQQLNESLSEEVYRPFNLEHGPLMRITLFEQGDGGYLALLAMHHSITDMWSLAIFMHELGLLYSAQLSATSPPLKPLTSDYAEFVRAQSELLAGPQGERLQAYWQQQLAGPLPLLNLPTDRPRSPLLSHRGAAHSLRLSSALTRQLKALAKAQATNLYTLCLAAFQLLLHRYSGQDEILVASPKACRDRKQARLIGYFVNPVVLRARLAGNPTFPQFLAQVHQTVLAAFAHGDYPYALLVERLPLARELSRPPLCQVALAWQKTTSLVSPQMSTFALNDQGGRLEIAELTYESVALGQRVAPFEITLQLGEANDELGATMEYNADLFEASTITRMLGHYRQLLAGIAANPEQPIAALPLLTEAEAQQLLLDWNQTAAPYPEQSCIHHLFEAQVEQQPDASAITFEGQMLSYQALNARANQLAHYLQQRGVGPEVIVAICLERSIEMIVAVLGVLKAGGAYLPIDPAYPQERQAFMLADSQARALLTQESLLAQLPSPQAQVICLDADWAAIAQHSTANPEGQVTADHLAYCIYTSGSTGQPKGTLLAHRGLCNFALAYGQGMGISAESRFLQFAAFSFDASVAETFIALLAGATLCLARRETLLAGLGLIRWLHEQAITAAILPPSVLKLLPAEEAPALRTVISAGEACSREIVGRWAPGRHFFNAYGPTEATIGPTFGRVKEAPAEASNIPIGRPIANIRIYLLDAHLQPVPIGVPGELCIGGVGLARGYLNCPELTAEKFIPNPFSQQPGARLYRTGDLARYLPDGNLEFLQRLDRQVKLRGFRIELEEIEAKLEEHPALRQVAVLPTEAQPGDQRLVAYVVPQASVTSEELRAYLRSQLPDYMVPAAFVTLAALPLTPSGKVDSQALLGLRPERAELAASYRAPQTAWEQRIAAVWQEVLGVERVGVQENFFDLGGHSLLLAKLQGRLQELTGKEIPLVEMFRHPTIRALAQHLTEEPEIQRMRPSVYDRAEKQREAIQQQHQRAISRNRLIALPQLSKNTSES